jgi:uncharacterized protein YbjT (DUF2867 family)
VDLTTGTGLDLSGVDTVIDVSSVQTLSAPESTRFFTAATRTLVAAGRSAGVQHHLALSIVGTDAAPFGYYAGKLGQERLVAGSPVPWTILRATQFHEFAGQLLSRTRRGPVAAVPVMRSQPVAAREVAARLVELAESGPAGRVADLAGPRPENMTDLVRRWARATGTRVRVLSLPLPGRLGRAMRDGTLLPGEGAQLGTQTFDDWLAAFATRQ